MTDEEAIRATIMGYNIAGDQRDGDRFAALFAEDAVLEYAGLARRPASAARAVPRSPRAPPAGTGARHGPSLSATGFIRHNLTTSEIALTGPDSARARTYFVVMTELGPDHAGSHDDLVRRYGKWLFNPPPHRARLARARQPVPAGRARCRRRPSRSAPGQRRPDEPLCPCLDSRDWDLLTSILTEDASLYAREWNENADPGAFTIHMEGREGILGTLQYMSSGLSRTHHMLSNYVVDPAPDGRLARASCYMRAHHVGNHERSPPVRGITRPVRFRDRPRGPCLAHPPDGREHHGDAGYSRRVPAGAVECRLCASVILNLFQIHPCSQSRA